MTKTVDPMVWPYAHTMCHPDEKRMDGSNTPIEKTPEKLSKSSLAANMRFAICVAVSIPLMQIHLEPEKF